MDKKPRYTLESLQREVAAQIVDMLKKDGLKGIQRWVAPRTPCNAVSGRPYRNSNVLTTSLWMMLNDTDDPRFVSKGNAFAKNHGRTVGKLKKGSRGIPILQPKSFTTTDETTGDEVTRITFRVIYVWHVSMFDDLDESIIVPPLVGEPNPDPVARNETIDAFVQATGAKLSEGNAAYYMPSSDTVTLPPFSHFLKDEKKGYTAPDLYYGTLFHELIHWTGAKHRLNRDKKYHTEQGRAYEELIAEIGAVMLGVHFGIQAEPREDNAAYVQSWIRALEDKPKTIFSATSAAGKGVEYLLDAAGLLEKETTHEKEAA